jgi:thymidylate synthase (FAD)
MNIVPMSVTLIDSMGSDLSVVNAARVSFAKESEWEQVEIQGHDHYTQYAYELSEKDAKLIGYLAKHGHWTPFAHAFLSFRIKAPIFVARQLVKHQVGLAWNEVSRRYVDDEPEFWLPEIWRKRADNVKQGSSHDEVENGEHIQCESLYMALDDYKGLLEMGVAPEQARMVLPQNTMTEWIWSGSLAAFARVCKLRLDPHAQSETREVAEKIAAQVPQGFKHSWQALMV